MYITIYIYIYTRDRIISRTLMMLITKTLMTETGCRGRSIWDLVFVSHYSLVWLQMYCNWSCHMLQVAIFYVCYYISFSMCWPQRSYKISTNRILFVLLRHLEDKILLYIFENKFLGEHFNLINKKWTDNGARRTKGFTILSLTEYYGHQIKALEMIQIHRTHWEKRKCVNFISISF